MISQFWCWCVCALQAAALAGENETLRADKRVAALEAELDGVRQELAAVSEIPVPTPSCVALDTDGSGYVALQVASEAMAKEEEMKEMKKKFAQVMDKMGGLQMGTTEVTSGQIGDRTADSSAMAIETPQLPPMGKKPAGIGQHARQFDMPNAEEIHKYAIHLGIDPMEDKEFLWLAEEALCAPLPPHWTEHLDPDKGVYYFNANTGESAWGKLVPTFVDYIWPVALLYWCSRSVMQGRSNQCYLDCACYLQSTQWTTTTASCSSRCTRTRRRCCG
eukprot:COSAG02_NODE_4634_length_5144_cov_3.059663_2_plen_276_part_00